MNKEELQKEYNKLVEDHKALQEAYQDVNDNLRKVMGESLLKTRSMDQEAKLLERKLNWFRDDRAELLTIIDDYHYNTRKYRDTWYQTGGIKKFFIGKKLVNKILTQYHIFRSKIINPSNETSRR